MRCVVLGIVLALVEGGQLPNWAYLKWGGSTDQDELLPTSPAKVSLVSQLPDGCSEAGTLPFAIQGGAKYRCCKADKAPENVVDYTEAKELLRSSDVHGVRELLAKHRVSSLTWETSQWWSYEVCFGQYIRQYHAEDSVIKSEFILGLGASAPEKACHSAIRYESKKETIKDKIKKLHALNQENGLTPPSAAWRFMGTLGSSPYLTTTYGNGEVCDLTGAPRTVELRLHCRQGNYPVFNITEVGECRYVANVNLDSVCDFAPYMTVEEYLKDNEVISPKEKRERAIKKRQSVLTAQHIPEVYDAISRDLGAQGCVTLTTDGWWAYELCLKHWLRQYHEVEGVVHDEFFIGRGVYANKGTDPVMTKARNYMVGGVKQKVTMRTRSVVKESLKANGTWTAHGEAGQYYFKTHMANGQVCDITGQPREAEIQLYCNTGVDRMLTVLEVATCRYEAKLYLDAVCRMDAYKQLLEGDMVHKEARPVLLFCAPEDGVLTDGMGVGKTPRRIFAGPV